MDIADLKEILRILEAQDITEFELEQDGVKLRVCRAAAGPGPHPGLVYGAAVAPIASVTAGRGADPPATTSPEAAAGADAAPERAADGTVVKSPIVGTFYRSPDPNAAAFVSVGDKVKVGQILCIIEAMKLMNEIESELAGEIVKVHPENGQPVQYGDPLFTIRPA